MPKVSSKRQITIPIDQLLKELNLTFEGLHTFDVAAPAPNYGKYLLNNSWQRRQECIMRIVINIAKVSWK